MFFCFFFAIWLISLILFLIFYSLYQLSMYEDPLVEKRERKLFANGRDIKLSFPLAENEYLEKLVNSDGREVYQVKRRRLSQKNEYLEQLVELFKSIVLFGVSAVFWGVGFIIVVFFLVTFFSQGSPGDDWESRVHTHILSR
ncbi:MAG: hypothetical protein KGV48_002715 [Alcaligenaceae bacterium]|nr:hypothetical protein [Alcaligenaceae bacterium]